MPRGFNSLAVKAHHPPQASLAWQAARPVVKRRQQVLRPCAGAPKLLTRGSLRRIGYGGSTEAPRRWGAEVRPGSKSRAKAQNGHPRNPRLRGGRLCEVPVFPAENHGLTASDRNPGARRQEASSYLTERRRGLGLEPRDESISHWVRVRGSRSVA